MLTQVSGFSFFYRGLQTQKWVPFPANGTASYNGHQVTRQVAKHSRKESTATWASIRERQHIGARGGHKWEVVKGKGALLFGTLSEKDGL